MLSEVRSFRDGNAEFILLVDEMEIYLIVGRYKADRLTSEWILLARDPTWRKTHIIAKCGEDEAIQVTYVEFIHRLPLMAPLVFDLSLSLCLFNAILASSTLEFPLTICWRLCLNISYCRHSDRQVAVACSKASNPR